MDLASCGSSDAAPLDDNVSWSQLEPHQKEQFFSDAESDKVSFVISATPSKCSDMSDVDCEVHLPVAQTMCSIDETVRETRNSTVVLDAVVTTPPVMPASARSSKSESSKSNDSADEAPEASSAVCRSAGGLEHEKKLRAMLWSTSSIEVDTPLSETAQSTIQESQEPEAKPSVLAEPEPKAKKLKRKPKKLTRKGKPKKTVTKSKKQGKTFGRLKKLKAVVKKQPKNSKAAPKKKPKAKGKPKAAGNSLEELDQESDRLKQKIERITSRKDTVHANNGSDHPTVKKLGRQIQTLSKKLRTVSMKRYKLRC